MSTLAVLVTLISTYFVAARVFDALFPQLRGFSRLGLISMGSLLFLMWFSFICAWLFGFTNSYWVMVVIAIVPMSELLIIHRTRLQWHTWRIFLIKERAAVLCILAVLGIFGLLLNSRMYLPGPEGLYSGGSTWADLSLHSTFITHFAQTNTVRFDSPVWSGTRNTYPWLFDLYTAWLLRSGLTLRQALLLSSWQAAIPLILLFIAIGKTLLLKKVGLIIATLWFFLAGGLGFFYFKGDLQRSGLSISEFLQYMPNQYTNDPARGMYFSTPITDVLLPQRGALVGVGIIFGCVLLITQWTRTTTKRSIMSIGLVIGLLPLIHAHLFFVSVGLFVLSGVIRWWKKDLFSVALKQWLLALGLLAVLAIPQLVWLLSGQAGSSFLAIDPLWMFSFPPNASPMTHLFAILSFILLNFSPAFFFFLVTIKYFHERKHDLHILLYVSTVGILVLTLIIRFQPNPYDNIKFLIVALAFASLLAGSVLERWWSKYNWVIATAVMIGCLSGSLSLIREYFHRYPMFGFTEIQQVEESVSVLPPGSILATAPHHHVPLSSIGGYSLYSGYPGWLWTYGIHYAERTSTLRHAYAGNTDAIQQLKDQGVTHLVLSPLEAREYEISPMWENITAIYETNNLRIIELNAVPVL